jgi:hypothetical protein
MKKLLFGSAILLITGFSVAQANDYNHTSSQNSSQTMNNPDLQIANLPVGVHNILSDQLPAMLRAHIKEDYKGYWITELYVEGSSTEPSYYITVENGDQIIKMNAADSENWVITSTIQKGV